MSNLSHPGNHLRLAHPFNNNIPLPPTYTGSWNELTAEERTLLIKIDTVTEVVHHQLHDQEHRIIQQEQCILQ